MADRPFSRRFRRLSGFVLLSLGAFSALHAIAAGPNFTGTWKLDSKRSNFGSLPAPGTITDRVTQSSTELTINRDRDGDTVVIHVPLDASERMNTIRGIDMKTHGHLAADGLIINYDGRRAGGPVSSEEHWTIGPDGNTLTVRRHLTSENGEVDQTLLLVKK